MVRKMFLPIFLIFVLFFVSCDNFFSTSWGSPRNYDLSKIKINAGNVDEWIDSAIGNPDLADAITEKIINLLDKANDNTSDDFAILQDAGVKLAIEASGIGAAIINSADILSKIIDDIDEDESMDALEDIVKKIQADIGSAGDKAAGNIAKILDHSISETSNGKFEFDSTNSFADNLSPADASQAIIILTIALAPDISEIDFSDVDDISDIFDHDVEVVGGKIIINESDPEPELIALAALLNLIGDDDRFDDNPITSLLRELFFDN